MHAIILVAGMGRRYHPQPLPHPKCLHLIGGKSLLARSLENLKWAGCDAVTMVTGFRAEMIAEEVAQLDSLLPIDLRFNPDFGNGSAGSVVCAADRLEDGPALMLDSDYLYDRRILRALIDAAGENVFALVAGFQESPPEWWLYGQGSRLTGMYYGTHKEAAAVGLYWGFHKFSSSVGKAFAHLAREKFLANPLSEYWDVFPNLFSDWRINYLDTHGLPYCEMDTWHELEWARTHTYPQLLALGQA